MPEKNISQNIKWGIAAGMSLFSIFLLYLNILYPYYPGDDMIFQLMIPDNGIVGSRPITSVIDLITSQVNFYYNYHYRIFNHTVLQALLAMPPLVFDIVNVIVFLLLPWPILRILNIKQEGQAWIKYAILILFIWIFHINIGWSYFHTTGALNYTWMLIPQLMYVALLIRYLEGNENLKKQLIGLALVNSLANENACVMLLCTTALAWLWTRDRKNKFLVLIMAIMIIGGGFMLLSPSLGKRLVGQGHMSGGLIAHTKEFVLRTGYYLIRYLPILAILWIGRTRGLLRSQRHILLSVAFVTATLSMILAPIFEPRSAVLGFFLLIVLCSSLSEGPWKRWVLYLFVIAGILIALYRTPPFQKQHERYLINEQILENNRGSKDIVYLQKYCDNTVRDYLLCHENHFESSSLNNRSAAALYNISEVALSPLLTKGNREEKVFSSIKKKGLDDYKAIKLTDELTAYYKKHDTGQDLILKTKSTKKPFYIVRGSKRGNIIHRLYNLIPARYRLYFIDNLEGVTSRSQSVLHLSGNTYNYFYLGLDYDYREILISLYDFNAHSPIGEILSIKFN